VGGGQFLIMNSGTTYTATSTTDINDSQWHHIVGSYDGTTMKIYIDGTLEDTNTDFSGNLPIVDGNVRIGADYQSTPDNFFSGLIDEARIYNRALSADEVGELYRAGARTMQINSPITNYLTDGLVGHWTFNGPDMDWASSTAEALDRSGNANNGNVTNFGQEAVTGGATGQALRFDGVGDYIAAGDVYNGVKTLAFWLKADNVASKKIIDIDGTDQIETDGSGNILATSFPAATIYIDSVVASLITTDWHFVAITDTTGVNASAMDIGRVAAGYFSGLIDEARIYNRALSADEVGELYRVGARKMRLKR
ncbi:LamG domain-containing protein, partial [Candidatus Parcubacteria bacterium]|nr:LamG domain-containing protein [Candidatus Parcubacteria bacterium]